MNVACHAECPPQRGLEPGWRYGAPSYDGEIVESTMQARRLFLMTGPNWMGQSSLGLPNWGNVCSIGMLAPAAQPRLGIDFYSYPVWGKLDR